MIIFIKKGTKIEILNQILDGEKYLEKKAKETSDIAVIQYEFDSFRIRHAYGERLWSFCTKRTDQVFMIIDPKFATFETIMTVISAISEFIKEEDLN